MASVTGLCSLPPEILLMVMTNISELESLANLVIASSHVWRCFGSYGLEIVDKVLDRDHMHDHIRNSIRWIAFIREGRPPPVHIYRPPSSSEWDDYDFYELKRQPREAFDLCSFPKGCSFQTVRGILMTARSISFSVSESLNMNVSLARRSRLSMNLNSAHNAYQGFTLSIADTETDEAKPLSPRSTLYWSEEQIVTGAFWRCQVIHELRHAACSCELKEWSEEAICALMESTIPDIYDTVWTTKFLQRDGTSLHSMDFFNGPFGQTEKSEHFVIVTLSDYLKRQIPQSKPPSKWSRSWPSLKPQPWESHLLPVRWGRNAHIFDNTRFRSVVDQIDFQVFRGYVYAIWSLKRLTPKDSNDIPSRCRCHGLTAWTSTFGQVQIDRTGMCKESTALTSEQDDTSSAEAEDSSSDDDYI